MFPTISSLLEYIFGVVIDFPIPTFGFFVLLAFFLSYVTFLSEFKRKEAEGVVKSFEHDVVIGNGATLTAFLEAGLLGFIVGFKLVGVFFYKEMFLNEPLNFIFSLQGSWLFGFLISSACACLIYLQGKKEKLDKPISTKIIIHPYQLMPKLVIWAAIWGFLGAKIFNYMENFHMYNNYPFTYFIKYSGLTFFGGLVFGGFSFLYIGHKRGIRILDLADIGSPGMLVAYGVGRIGCQLSGDGDWGIVNNYIKPVSWLPEWMWSFRFPHNVLNQGEYIPGCTGKYCFMLPKGVFPTSFYESIIILSCFFIIWVKRRSIKSTGRMLSFYLIIVGLERFFIENFRVNFKYDLFSWHLSEAQIISVIFVLLAVPIGVNGKRKNLNRHG